MAKLRSQVGFWNAVGHLRLGDFASIESLTSVGLGASFALVLYGVGSVNDRAEAASMFVGVVAALVGIVFAGMALVVSLLSDAYLLLLAESEAGVLGFLRPFMLTIGTQVTTVLGAVFYASLVRTIPEAIEPWLFGALSIMFAASCLDVVVLMRSVFMHALLRTRFAQVIKRSNEEGGNSER